MKAMLVAVSLIMTFVWLPISWFQGYLLYQHVHATELMWFIWFINIPVGVVTSILGVLLREASKK